MKRQLILMVLTALIVILVGCGSESGKFRLQGRLRNLNQGEFLIYSSDGGFVGIDTIKVRDGRFSYEQKVRNEATFIIIFPNYSEQVVFAESDGKVEIKGDATHLKELVITGTDNNKELTRLRQRVNRLTPPEVQPVIVEYIKEHPQSIVSTYLLNKYFIFGQQPDYHQAYQLVSLMLKKNPDNGRLRKLAGQLEGLQYSQEKKILPVFSTTDMKGKKITNGQLRSKVNVISTWASWNYQSTDIQRRLQKIRKKHPEISLLSICLDGDKRECQRKIDRDSLQWAIVWDGKMFQTPIVEKLGLFTVPSVLITNHQGRIIKCNLKPNDIESEIEKILE